MNSGASWNAGKSHSSSSFSSSPSSSSTYILPQSWLTIMTGLQMEPGRCFLRGGGGGGIWLLMIRLNKDTIVAGF